MYDKTNSTINYQLIPELMYGVNKNLMVHLDGFFTNQNGNFHAVGMRNLCEIQDLFSGCS